MSLASIQAVTCGFGGRPLFEDITLVVESGERLGLIGPNGSGKSTLLKMIAKERDPDEGAVTVRRGLRVSHVRQAEEFQSGATVESTLLAAVAEWDGQEQKRRVSRILGSVGFVDRAQAVSSLSGGWRKRLAIAVGLIVQPDLLLLDEPTNHLDIEGILWLEEALEEFSGALVFVSHDRYFIERTALRVVEINRRYPQGFLSVPGRYSDFLETREQFIAQLASQRASLANRVRREVEWLRQGAKARTTKQSARIKQAGELQEALKAFHVGDRTAQAEFTASGRQTKELAVLDRVVLQRGERTLLKDFSFTLAPGIRLGIVGGNGSGKSSLIKALLNELPIKGGVCRRATNLVMSYFDQHRSQLNPQETLKRALSPNSDTVVFNGRPIHVTGWAQRFLLRPDQLATPVRELSGGEQARVMVARMMVTPCDLLLLDEPTNDLDIPTLEVLEEALSEFAGAVVIVSHDRYLLDRVCTHLLGLRGDGAFVLCSSYLQWELQQREWKSGESDETSRSPMRGGAPAPAARGTPKLSHKEERELSSIEGKIRASEGRVAEIQQLLADPKVAENAAKLTELCDALAEATEETERLYARWGELEKAKNLVGS